MNFGDADILCIVQHFIQKRSNRLKYRPAVMWSSGFSAIYTISVQCSPVSQYKLHNGSFLESVLCFVFYMDSVNNKKSKNVKNDFFYLAQLKKPIL